MGRKSTWTPELNQYIIDNASTQTDAKLIEGLRAISNKKFSIQTVRKQRQHLGLFKLAGRGRCQLRPTQTNLVDTPAPEHTGGFIESGEEKVDALVSDGNSFLFTPKGDGG